MVITCVKPIRICHWNLVKGQRLEVEEIKESEWGTIFRPKGFGMEKGAHWKLSDHFKLPKD